MWRTNGHESIEFKNGGRIRSRTRTKGGGRGFSGDFVAFDEAMILSEVSMGAILPVVSAQPDPQIWYTGSAVDQLVHDDGVVFARVRDRALKGTDPRLAYFEWSVDAIDPDDIEEDVSANPAAWGQANPALGIRIDPDYVADERRELAPRTFAVERLGVGDWPATDGSASMVVDIDQWDGLADRESAPSDPLCFAFDIAPDRSSASISVAGRRHDGLDHVEVVDRRRGTGWVVGRLVELNERHRPSAFVCDGSGPASSLLPDLRDRGIEALTVTAGEQAQACGMFYDLVDQARLRHLGTPELRAALRGAATRPLGDSWAWSRKSSSVDISPLVASTLALWGLATAVSQDVWVI